MLSLSWRNHPISKNPNPKSEDKCDDVNTVFKTILFETLGCLSFFIMTYNRNEYSYSFIN
jgi:hypothetical protein